MIEKYHCAEVKVVVVFDAMLSGLPTHKEDFAGYIFEIFSNVPGIISYTFLLRSGILECRERQKTVTAIRSTCFVPLIYLIPSCHVS